MSDNNKQEWVLAAAIPFAELKGRDLEECVYWLLDAMGAKDLEWRIGGAGGGAADGGRDLEAYLFEPDDDGELRRQKWWVECKGRKGTVEPDEVKAAVNNALAYEELDRLIIATNTQFSNPTRDWVKEWQKKHAAPKIQLWDRTHLERYLSRHPDVVLRLFSEALSIQGRFQAMENRFWNKLEFVPPKTMVDLWKDRRTLDVTAMGMFAAIANEFANGDIARRPWGAAMDLCSAVAVLTSGLHNAGYLLFRSSRAGIDQRILIRVFAYMILVVLELLSVDDVSRLVVDSLSHSDTEPLPEEVQEMLLMPILDQVLSEMQDVCSDDCRRIVAFSRNTLVGERDEIKTYWLRFEANGIKEENDTRSLRMERHDGTCVVGFPVGKDHGCPLYEIEPSIRNVSELMAIIERVASFRKDQAKTQRKAEEASRALTKSAKTAEHPKLNQ